MDNLDSAAQQDHLLSFNDFSDNRPDTYPSFPYYLNQPVWPLGPLGIDAAEEEEMPSHALHSHVLEQQQQQHQRAQQSYHAQRARAIHNLSTASGIGRHALSLPASHALENGNDLLQPSWQYGYQTHLQQHHLAQEAALNTSYATNYAGPLQPSPVDFGLPITAAHMQMGMQQYIPLDGPIENMGALAYTLDDYAMALPMPIPSTLSVQTAGLYQSSLAGSSPTGSSVEVCSLSSSDNGWNAVNFSHSRFASIGDNNATNAVFNPSQTLHIRADSDASDCSPSGQHSSHDDLIFPHYSPSDERSSFDFVTTPSPQLSRSHQQLHSRSGSEACAVNSPEDDSSSSSVVSPVAGIDIRTIRQQTSPPRRRPNSASSSPPSPPKGSGVMLGPSRRKSDLDPLARTTRPAISRDTTAAAKKKKANEKRVGKRSGPLTKEARESAHEIRKLRACTRCRFLKKTCDPGEPCAGCRPSHARLWQVPCTRIDIRDMGYFVKDWKVDYQRHVTLGFSVANITNFAENERTMFVTHGFGHFFPITVRKVFVKDESCFGVDWVEQGHSMTQYEVNTAKLSAGKEGVNATLLSEYIDSHLEDGAFGTFVHEYFNGTPFLTEILQTAYTYYMRTGTPAIRKALRLVVAYSLTQQVTFIDGLTSEESAGAYVDDESSQFKGKTCAPVMINFEVKCAMAEIWRELMKDVLEELSTMYSSVYHGDKLRHWPTIFMMATLLLAVWEMMQFDAHYRELDENKVEKFCNDMESTPVGVIVGLFHAISQKLPSLMEWDTAKFGQMLGGDEAICDALTEVKEHVTTHESYLRSRASATFNRNDFDCLSNRFLSRMVIRAN